MGKLVRLLLGLAAAIALVAGGAAAASAADPTPGPFATPTPNPSAAASLPPSAHPTPAPGPSAPPLQQCNAQGNATKGGVGIQGLIELPCLRGSQPPKLFERYPAASYGIHTGTNAVSNVFNGGFTFVAGFLFGWITALGTFCVAMLEWAFSLQLISGLGSNVNLSAPLDGVMQQMDDHVYRPFIFVALGVVALYITWFGVLRRRMSLVVESLGWVLLASTVAALFFAAPAYIVGSLDNISQTISNGIMEAVSQADPGSSGANGFTSAGQYNGVRSAVDRYWQIYVFQPWQVAEFGSFDLANSTGSDQCGKPPNNLTWSEYELQANATDKQSDFADAYQKYLDCSGQSSALNWWNGGVGVQRMMVAILALITITIASILLIVIAAAILIAQIGAVVMTMVAPLFFLIGVLPGTGRRIFLRWGEMLLGFFLRRILYSAFLSIILVVGGIIVSQLSNQSWFLAAVLQIVVVVAAFIYRKPMAAVFQQLGAGHLDRHLAPHRERLGKLGAVGAGAIGERLSESFRSGVARARETPAIPFNEKAAQDMLGGGPGAGGGGGVASGPAAKAAAGAAAGGVAGAAAGAASGVASQAASYAKRKVTRMVNIPGGVMVDSWEEGVRFKGNADDVKRQHRDSVLAPDYVNELTPPAGEARRAAWSKEESPAPPPGPSSPAGAALLLRSNGDVRRVLPPPALPRPPGSSPRLPPPKDDDE